MFVLLTLVCCCIENQKQEQTRDYIDTGGNKSFGEINDDELKLIGKIKIADVSDFKFNPWEIETLREDSFMEGHFSVFDILAYPDKTGSIDMEYHFDEEITLLNLN